MSTGHPTGDDPVPPHDVEAEIAVLGSMLLDPKAARDVVEIISADDLYIARHAVVFRAFDFFAQDERPIDLVLVQAHLRASGLLEAAGGAEFVNDLPARVPTAANAKYYARIVRDHARRRRLANASERVRGAAATGDADQLEAALSELDRARAPGRRDDERASEFASRVRRADRLLLDATVADDQVWIVGDGLLPRGGISFLTAPLKAGKSLVSLGLAVDLAAGLVIPNYTATFLGSPVATFGPVLYMSAEGGEVLLKKRLARISAGIAGHALGALHLHTKKPRPDLGSDRDVRAVYRFARDEGCVAVIWDPLGRFWRPEDENDAVFARDMMDRVEAESVAANSATLISHHENKKDTDEKITITAGRGSGRLGDDASGAIINLARVGKRTDPPESWRITANFLVRDGEQLPTRTFRIDSETARFVAAEPLPRATGSAARSGRGAAAQTVSDLTLLRVLRDFGEWTPIKAWGEAVGLSRPQMHERVQPLLSKDQIERRTGKYARLEYRIKVSEVSDDQRPTGREA